MRQLMIAFVLLATMTFSTNIQAQTTCTPAQKEACKKICDANQGKCTPEQIAACKKVCNGKAAAASVPAVNQSPQKATTGSGAAGLVKLASLNKLNLVDEKKEGKQCKPASCIQKKKE